MRRAAFPPQIPFIIGNEACERFSFYGMRSILTVFLIQYLLAHEAANASQTQATAKSIFHTFVMGVYFTPLLGGFLADRFLGKYRTVLYLSLLYCLGHLCLALFDTQKLGFYSGLFLIALGSGGIKPCVASFMGDQFDESNKALATRAFGLFYWIINFGSFFASLSIPVLLNRFGPKVAFGVPGILMAIATLVFWLGRKRYVHVPPSRGARVHGFFAVLKSGFKRGPSATTGRVSPQSGSFWDRALSEHPPEAVEAVRAVLRILPIFLMVSLFFSIFDQKASTVVIQGRQMQREILGITIAESQMQALNPLLVMLLIPASQVVYPWLEKAGYRPTPLRRMTAGIVLSGVAFAMVGVIQVWINAGHSPNIAWQMLPYFVLTVAEILVSTTGLEFAYSQAPLEMKGAVMSFWYLTNAIGNLWVVVIIAVNVFEGAGQIFGFAALAWLAALGFGLLARRYRSTEYFRKAELPS